MKVCPICSAPVACTVTVNCYQDADGRWVVDGDLDDICESPTTPVVCCNNVNCGNAIIYSDLDHLIQVGVIKALPEYGTVIEDQLWDYYDVFILMKPAGTRDECDIKSFNYWRRNFIEYQPWSGLMIDAVDV